MSTNSMHETIVPLTLILKARIKHALAITMRKVFIISSTSVLDNLALDISRLD
jgi:hypothetical protein